MRRTALMLCFLFLFLAGAGCTTPQNAPAPKLAKVSGTAKVDGKLMKEGEITFTFPGQGPKSFEITSSGTFSGEVYAGKNQSVDIRAYWWMAPQPPPMPSNRPKSTNLLRTSSRLKFPKPGKVISRSTLARNSRFGFSAAEPRTGICFCVRGSKFTRTFVID